MALGILRGMIINFIISQKVSVYKIVIIFLLYLNELTLILLTMCL
jgi:hypothetical protein